jgi:ferritin
MLSTKMQDALNDQLNAEIYSAYLYLSMEAYFQDKSLTGFANWMRVQTQEELTHAQKFYDFINERGGRVKLKPIDAPPWDWESPLAVFEAAYKHETIVTGLINKLVDLALVESDHATDTFLQWFVSEQVEEEDNTSTVVDRIKLVGEVSGGLFLLDQELGQRTFTPPVDTAAA